MSGGLMAGKTVLITGGTGGIGYATAQGLARAGARVVVAGRRREAAEQAAATLREASGGEVEVVLGDLETRAGVRALAASFRGRFERLDVLINNAGLMASERVMTADGVESGFAVNVVAPLLLTHELLAPLRASPGPRVVTLAGGSHPARVDLDNLQGERSFVALTQYSHHKLAMMGVMRELASRLAGVAVNVCYPGQASTRMTQGVKAGDFPWLVRPFWPLFRLLTRDDGGRSAEKASRSSIRLASDPALAGVSGSYFDLKSNEVPWPSALDGSGVCGRLWAEAVRLGGLEGASW